jgi:hypothetical protein
MTFEEKYLGNGARLACDVAVRSEADSRSRCAQGRRDRPRLPRGLGALALLALAFSACAVASAPLADRPKIAATPVSGQLSVVSQASEPIGDLIPVYVSIANGSDVGRTIVPSQIFAIDQDGDRIAPIPPGEAARQAGNTRSLGAAVKSGAVSGALEGAFGAAVGAIAGAFLGGTATGAALGGAVGAGSGAVQGVMMGPGAAQGQANAQIGSLALAGGDVRKDFSVGGYVFFPSGSYQSLELLVVNDETGGTETITLPWH